MTNLEDLIGGQVALAQKSGTPVKNHMLKLMGFFKEVENNEVELDVNTQNKIVFKSLTKEFPGFKVTYNLGNKTLTLTQLMKELKFFELMLNDGKLVQEKLEANLVMGPSSSKRKQKAKGKKKPTKSSVPPHVDRKKTKKLKDPKKNDCFFYNRKGHFGLIK
ncbi:uncharacterized protein LOC108476331 [Gossypium arboreum]|uniref:Uncharacterized protein n=1 Tax=Gossypium arboreum TaxID=29729 RepID=A0ABR0PD47_GOSAR|nr:uncharacterized protein LOC108476331 [Gossypium arboreum]KAK5819216.1 hypothetical protein PVK06_024187 [Gossypium arboreum]